MRIEKNSSSNTDTDADSMLIIIIAYILKWCSKKDKSYSIVKIIILLPKNSDSLNSFKIMPTECNMIKYICMMIIKLISQCSAVQWN